MKQSARQLPVPSHTFPVPQPVPAFAAGWVQLPPPQTSLVQGLLSVAQVVVDGAAVHPSVRVATSQIWQGFWGLLFPSA